MSSRQCPLTLDGISSRQFLSPLTLGGITVNVTQPFNVGAGTKKVLSCFSVVCEGKLGFQIFFLGMKKINDSTERARLSTYYSTVTAEYS